jgi:hypothetical protein
MIGKPTCLTGSAAYQPGYSFLPVTLTFTTGLLSSSLAYFVRTPATLMATIRNHTPPRHAAAHLSETDSRGSCSTHTDRHTHTLTCRTVCQHFDSESSPCRAMRMSAAAAHLRLARRFEERTLRMHTRTRTTAHLLAQTRQSVSLWTLRVQMPSTHPRALDMQLLTSAQLVDSRNAHSACTRALDNCSPSCTNKTERKSADSSASNAQYARAHSICCCSPPFSSLIRGTHITHAYVHSTTAHFHKTERKWILASNAHYTRATHSICCCSPR